MTVVNTAMVAHHTARLLFLVAGDDDGPLTPVGDVVVDEAAGYLSGRFAAADSDGVGWVVSVRPQVGRSDRPATRAMLAEMIGDLTGADPGQAAAMAAAVLSGWIQHNRS